MLLLESSEPERRNKTAVNIVHWILTQECSEKAGLVSPKFKLSMQITILYEISIAISNMNL